MDAYAAQSCFYSALKVHTIISVHPLTQRCPQGFEDAIEELSEALQLPTKDSLGKSCGTPWQVQPVELWLSYIGPWPGTVNGRFPFWGYFCEVTSCCPHLRGIPCD